jgi:hypothetical protein
MQDPANNLTTSGTRALVAVMCRGAVPDLPPHTATVAVDALDAITRTLLVDVLGLSPAEALTVLAELWGVR